MKEHDFEKCTHDDDYCDNSDQSCVLSTCKVCGATDSIPGEQIPAKCPERKLTDFEKRTGHVESTLCTCDGAGTCWGCNLFICEVCGGAESCLPSHCPGRKMTVGESEGVTECKLDFKDDQWIAK